VRSQPYLLRIITRTDAQADPTRHFACMKAVAEAGLAPRVHYASIPDRVLVTDFVPAVRFPRTEAIVRVPQTLRALHALAPFPPPAAYREVMDGFVRKFQAAGILPESEMTDTFKLPAREVAATALPPRPQDLVSSHNDLKPENMLFDGGRVWLVDWEAAFLNDRYTDLAVAGNFLITSDADEERYLAEYFGEPPGEYRRALFYLMQQTVHMYYASVFALLRSGGEPIDPDVQTPTFREFHDGLWSGEITLEGKPTRVQYALVHLRQMRRQMRAARFEKSLEIITANRGPA
jgi:hypothetical protein